tara:strand:+ start:263 stop:661 length:399 start_codon:yes stop_codon:yes gene_type:complete
MKNDAKKYVETNRSYLKQLTINDVSLRYVAWLNAPEINRYLESRFRHHSIESTMKYVVNCDKDPLVHKFRIFDKKNNCHIGNVKLSIVDIAKKIGEIGILIGEKHYWGQGVATEVIKAIMDFGFNVLKLNRC